MKLMMCTYNIYIYVSHSMHGTGIFTYFWLTFCGKCRYGIYIYAYMHHTWMLWVYLDMYDMYKIKPQPEKICM